jgi:proton-dependent oligopeptide transporter, POT family
MSTQVAPDSDARGTPELWGHPRELWMLLSVTVGFNFAFYGFRAYLAPYVAETFYAGLGPAAAQRQADLFTSGLLALMYATPIVGGYVADKLLGEVRSLAISLWLGIPALLLMALPSLFGFQIGIALFALSAGLSIPLTVLIGRNYGKDDPRLEGGYTLYYLATNLGGFLAPFVCADLVGRRFGYRWGFVAAAIAMAFAAVTLQLRSQKLRSVPTRADPPGGSMTTVCVVVAVAALVYPVALLLSVPRVLSTVMYVLMGLLVLHFVVSSIRRGDRVQTQRYIALLVLFVALVLFWALSFQGVTSLNFFARDHVSAPFDYTLFQSANPLFILLFAPVLALLWPWLGRRGKDPSTPRKFGIGLLLVALSYGLVAAAIHHSASAGAKVAWSVLAGCYLLQTLGELSLSPIGYSLVSLLVAPQEASLAMGGWFFGYALAYQLAGGIATFTTGASGGSPLGVAAYAHVYGLLFAVGVAASLVFLLGAPYVKKLMHGVH